MAVWRIIMALIFPPFAVIDKGCGMFALVFVLTMAGWFPGVFAALLIAYLDRQNGDNPRYVDVPARYVSVPVRNNLEAPPKRKGAFVQLDDGDVLEVIDDDDDQDWLSDEKRKRGY